LMLPAATRGGSIPFVDALFTSTSAVCVTGLIVVDTGTFFTVFGQMVILLLIQAGGLGIMTLSVFFFRQVGRGVSLHQRRIIQDLYAPTPRKDIWELLRIILLFTLISEGIGGVVLYVSWSGNGSVLPVFSALFHAVSAFCNAGFSLFADSLVGFSGSAAVSLTVAFLIILGGLGFPVIFDIMQKIKFRTIKGYRLSTQTKTVLSVSLMLIAGGALLILFLEFNGALKGMAWGEKILNSLFQSITCRTAGFNTIGISALGAATLILMIFLMFVGASPGSCGGGIKTTTAAVVAAHLVSRLKRREQPSLFRRGLPQDTVGKSMALILLASALIGVVYFCLLVFETDPGREHEKALPLFFEAVSAFGTVGLSMGITSGLTRVGKGLIIFLMITGRVGVLSMVYIIIGSGPRDARLYAEENIMIG